MKSKEQVQSMLSKSNEEYERMKLLCDKGHKYWINDNIIEAEMMKTSREIFILEWFLSDAM